MSDRCGTCRFYKSHNVMKDLQEETGEDLGVKDGFCKRHPPKVFAPTIRGAPQQDCPQVREVDWCGEYVWKGAAV